MSADSNPSLEWGELGSGGAPALIRRAPNSGVPGTLIEQNVLFVRLWVVSPAQIIDTKSKNYLAFLATFSEDGVSSDRARRLGIAGPFAEMTFPLRLSKEQL